MKSKRFFSTVIALVTSLMMAGCQKEETEVIYSELPVNKSCLDSWLQEESLYVIDSEEEYYSSVGDCLNNTDFIDFDKQSVLIAYGSTACNVESKDIKLYSKGGHFYLNIEIKEGVLEYPEGWIVCIQANDKIKKENISIKINKL